MVARRRRRSSDGEDAEVVFVAHVDEVDLAELERAARAVVGGAPLLTANYQPGYWGANGPIFSRGAMVTAGDREGRRRPADRRRQAVEGGGAARSASGSASPSGELRVVGDDLGMDIALGRLGGSRTVLVRTRHQRRRWTSTACPSGGGRTR